MTEALSISTKYIFQELNLHRIMANYMPHNRRSAKVLKRLGFVVEGYATDYLMINGQWEDHILTSLTNPHWRSDL
jgi:ribosomal-protein-alanine N-acetyltransferase